MGEGVGEGEAVGVSLELRVFVGVGDGVSEGVIVSLLVAVLVGVAVEVPVSFGVADEDNVGDGDAEAGEGGIFCRMGKSFATACHTVSVSQHSCWPPDEDPS